MSEMTWVDSQTKAQKEQARKNLELAHEQEQDKLNKGLIPFPIPIKKGIKVRHISPQEAQKRIDEGADCPTGVKIVVKKALESWN